MTSEALIFETDQSRFGIRSVDVRQVLQAVAISKLPGSSDLIEGIINLHGKVVPVLDFRKLFQMPPKEIAVSDHLIVIEIENLYFAIRVDRAIDLIELNADEETQLTIGHVEFTGVVAKTTLGLIYLVDSRELVSPASKSLGHLPSQGMEAAE